MTNQTQVKLCNCGHEPGFHKPHGNYEAKARQKSHAVLRLSDKLMEIIIDQDQFTMSDFQSALEAVIMNAIETGKSFANDNLLSDLKEARRQIEIMIERMPLDKLATSDSMMISKLTKTINSFKGETKDEKYTS